jgi:hypothetical protein
MKTNKILAELDFGSIIGESAGQTQTGSELLNKYKTHMMTHESTCGLVNSFVKEAQYCRYDNGVNTVLERVSDYINTNKTSWALASTCEQINANGSSYNYLNRNAAKQVETLLEMNEEEVVKYIKAGALKNVMFCEAFRNIAQQVFRNSPIVESTADYTAVHPCSMVENVGDGVCFEVAGMLFKISEDKKIQETTWDEVSNTFKTISNLLESRITTTDGKNIFVTLGDNEYTITEAGKCTKKCKKGEKCSESEFENSDQIRENSRMVLRTVNPRMQSQVASVLEGIALMCENFNSIMNLDNVSIYQTKNDKFLVIESGIDIYATLMNSNHCGKWTINESAMKAVDFIKSKTNVQLSEVYRENIQSQMNAISEEERQQMAAQLKDDQKNSIKQRIESLTEKFKNDPSKMAILAQLAEQLNTAE